MAMKRFASVLVLALSLAACGAAAPATAPASPSAPAPSAAAKPASAVPSVAGKPSAAASGTAASAKPAGSAGASAKPAASASAEAAASAFANPSASGLTPVKSSYSQATVTQGALFVGVEQGFFARNGLNVTVQQINASAQVASLIAGEVQIAGVGADSVAQADLGGAQLLSIATAVDLPFFNLDADKKYKTIQDLAGQSIGITTPGSSTDAAARLFLDHYSLTGKVKVTSAGNTQPAILAAVSNGAIAAGVFAPPFDQQAEKAGLVELVNGVKLGVPMNTAGIATSKAYIQDHKDTVLRFLKGYQQAWTYNADPANEAAVLKVLAKYTQTDEATVKGGYDLMLKVWQGSKTPAMNPEALANILKVSDNPKAKGANPNDFIDNSLLQSVQ
jgi:NitT/TauT family transport system substrate-binding protein